MPNALHTAGYQLETSPDVLPAHRCRVVKSILAGSGPADSRGAVFRLLVHTYRSYTA